MTSSGRRDYEINPILSGALRERQAQGERYEIPSILVPGNHPNPFGLSRRWRSLCEADSL